MEQLLIQRIILRIKDSKTKLLVSSLSYYAILAIIPTIFLTINVLNIFKVPLDFNHQFIRDKIGGNIVSGVVITGIVIYMISRAFLLIFKSKYPFIKSLIFSIILSIIFIIILTVFLATYTVSNLYLSNLIKILLLFIALLIFLYFVSNSNMKYSLIFSAFFSPTLATFFYFFAKISAFFIHYENYYGILAPIFIIFLAINIAINIISIAYISSEEFTYISKIKIIKR